MTKILAIDYGEKRIGLAITDALGITAVPLDTFLRDGTELIKISDLVRENNVEKIVVGLPLNMDGTQGLQAKKILEFVDQLKSELSNNIKIDLFDERLTTKETNRRLIEFNVSRKKRKKIIDKMTAALILQTYTQEKNQY